MATEVKRYRLSIPVEDTVVNEFMKNQHNVSFSCRMLVKMFVQKYGVQDVTCMLLSNDEVISKGEQKVESQLENKSIVSDKSLSEKSTDKTVDIKRDEDDFVDPNDLL